MTIEFYDLSAFYHSFQVGLFFLRYCLHYHLGCQFDGIQFHFLLCAYAFGVIGMRLMPFSGSNLQLYFFHKAYIVLAVIFRFVLNFGCLNLEQPRGPISFFHM